MIPRIIAQIFEFKICRLIAAACLLFFGTEGYAQSIRLEEENVLQDFKDIPEVRDRFVFFFSTPYRYQLNSAYDWLDTVTLELNKAKVEQDSVAMLNYGLIQAQLYFDIGDFNKSVTLANDLYAPELIRDEAVSKILLDLVDNGYGKLKLYDKQIEARMRKKELGLIDNVTFFDIYSSYGMHRKAMEDYIQDIKPTISEADLFGQAKYNNNVGKFLLKDKSGATALTYFNQAKSYITIYLNDPNEIKTENEIKDSQILLGRIEGNMGKSHLMLTQYEEAMPLLENGIRILQENLGNAYSEDVIDNHLALAETHIALGNFEKAKEYLDKDLAFKNTFHQIKRNRLLASYYDSQSDYENEKNYLVRNMQIQDSLNLAESKLLNQQLEALVGQELDYKGQLIETQREDLERTKNEIVAMDEQISLVFISLVFTLLGFAGLVYAYLKSIKNQRLIAEQKYIIENALVEKDSLLKEIHHRVKNNLQMVSSLLSLQTKNTRSKAAIAALEEGKTRVKAMALIHQKLYQNEDLSVIEMQGYIESLINSVQSVFKKGGHNINITIDAEGVELDIDRAIPFGLILNELVSNSFKYAFPDDKKDGKIYIHIRKTGESGFFEYMDNGVGLPEDSEDRANNSMGIRLMNRLANQLQSTLNIDKTVEGVRFWFNFK